MWNERYAGDDYLFGTEPAAFLHRAAEWLRPGATALAIADGEGRNSVWLAEQGLTVAAFDPAPNALAKARKLAAARGVVVDYHLASQTELRPSPSAIASAVAPGLSHSAAR